MKISPRELRRYLRYNARTGQFYWRISPAPNKKFLIGRVAGCICMPTAYVYIKIYGQGYLAHRLAWLYMNGVWPPDHIDHKNGVRHDNRWSNLRIAGWGRNAQNRPPKKGTKFGLKGIAYMNDRFRRKPFAAKIGANGKTHRLGYFRTPAEAHAAYCVAAQKLHGPFARTK